jgi:hypothetical protein
LWKKKAQQPGHAVDHNARSIAGCFQFFTLIQRFDLPP